MDEKSATPPARGEIQQSPGLLDFGKEIARRPAGNILSSGVEVKGTICFQQELRIDGRVEGEINSDGVLTIGHDAEIRGDIRSKLITVFGKVYGNVTAVDRCELKSRATLQGDLKTARVVIEEGAIFVGKSFVECWDAAQIMQQILESRSDEGGPSRGSE